VGLVDGLGAEYEIACMAEERLMNAAPTGMPRNADVGDTYALAAEKLQSAAQLLRRGNIDAWLIMTRAGSDPAMPLLFDIRSDKPAALFIMADGQHRALVSSDEQARYAASDLFSEVISWHGDFPAALSGLLERLSPGKLAINVSESDHLGDGLTYGQYLMLERAWGQARLAAAECSAAALLADLRSVKSPTELARMERAVAITNDIYDEVFAAARIGMSELEIGGLFVEGFKRHAVVNGLGGPYDMPIVCIVRAGLAHRKPGPTPLEPGDILICDLSVKYRDYVSDIARTAYVPRPGETAAPPDIEKAFRTARAAIDAAMAALRPGTRGYAVDAAGRAVIEAAGYPTIRHSVGHQVGRNCHDGGTLLGPRRATPRPEVEGQVKVGEIYAIEPTVIQDGGLPCMLVEEDVLVTADGVRVLSRRQDDLILITEQR
jgi:Xaa-Pro aminopeptidase